MDAIYILSPESYVVECLLADFQVRRYRRAYLVWTGLLDTPLRRKIDDFPGIRQLRASSTTLFADFYPREAGLVTFKDPWSFPLLYHPACNALVPKHMQILAQRVGSWRRGPQFWLELTLLPDCRCMHYTGGISQSPILPPDQRNS